MLSKSAIVTRVPTNEYETKKKMGDTQHFCLRWNNYQNSITTAFENLRDDEDFVDVTLACDGRSLKAHRVVLSACSPYFRELLKSTPCKHPVIVLQDVSFVDLHALVEFIYHGEVNVHQRNLSSFLKTAEVLRVSGLTQQPEEKEEDLSHPANLGRSSHHNFQEKHVDDNIFTSPSSPVVSSQHPIITAGGATVNQLLRRAAAAAALATSSRRERQNSTTEPPETTEPNQSSVTSKRPRSAVGENDHNLEPTTSIHPVTPTDFSISPFSSKQPQGTTSGGTRKHEEMNSGGDRDSSSSPTTGVYDGVKSEPMDLLGGGGGGGGDLENSNDSIEAIPDTPLTNQLHSSLNEREHEEGHQIPPYLSMAESKLFASAASAGSFGFSMAALAADPSLSGIGQGLQGNVDGALGSSPQGDGGAQQQSCLLAAKRGNVRGWASEGSGRPSKGTLQCPYCDKCLLNRDTLSRHVLHMHQEPLYASKCTLCNREYRTRNSLMVHMSRYHRKRDVSGSNASSLWEGIEDSQMTP